MRCSARARRAAGQLEEDKTLYAEGRKREKQPKKKKNPDRITEHLIVLYHPMSRTRLSMLSPN